MPEYTSWISDFPVRCGDVLDLADNRRLELLPDRFDREVTLMLCVAAAVINIPSAHLRESSHLLRDEERFREAWESFRKESFLKSKLWDDPDDPGSWRYGKIKDHTKDKAGKWRELSRAKALTPEKTIGGVHRILRNALAHGQICVEAQIEIDQIVFLSKVSDDAPEEIRVFLIVSPKDFKRFLRNWIKFLKELEETLKRGDD